MSMRECVHFARYARSTTVPEYEATPESGSTLYAGLTGMFQTLKYESLRGWFRHFKIFIYKKKKEKVGVPEVVWRHRPLIALLGKGSGLTLIYSLFCTHGQMKSPGTYVMLILLK